MKMRELMDLVGIVEMIEPISNRSLQTKVNRIARKYGVSIEAEIYNDVIRLYDISRAPASPAGNGAKAMRELCKIADAADMNIQLAAADGAPGLIRYYYQFGFRPFTSRNFDEWLRQHEAKYAEEGGEDVDHDGVDMARRPRPAGDE